MENKNKLVKINSSILTNYNPARRNEIYGGFLNDIYFNNCLSKLKAGDFAGTIEELNKAISLDPNNANAYKYRAICKAELEDIVGVIEDLNKAIVLNPNDSEAYELRASCKMELEDVVGVIEDLNKALSLNPAKYMNNTELKDLLKNAENTLELNPGAAEDFMNSNKSKVSLKDFDFNTAIEEKLKVKDYLGVIEYLTEIISTYPHLAEAYKVRASLKDILKDHIGAVDDYSKAIAIDSINAETYKLRAESRSKLGDYIGMNADYKKANTL